MEKTHSSVLMELISSSYVNQLSLSRDVNTLETTSFGSDQATFVVGVEGLSISGSATSMQQLMVFLLDCLMAHLWLSTIDQTTSSLPKYTGNAFVTNYTIDSSATDLVSISFSFIVTGAVTRGTV